MTDLQQEAKETLLEFLLAENIKTTIAPEFTIDDIYVVWFSKVLQNWKALLSTTRPDGRYYELTYNGDDAEFYIDVYAKVKNVAVPDMDRVAPVGGHEHKPVQHRDGREKWCDSCGLNADRLRPKGILRPPRPNLIR